MRNCIFAESSRRLANFHFAGLTLVAQDI
jgi:hypothetical protein